MTGKTGKSDRWDIRKSKFAVLYYILGIMLTFLMLMLLLGIFKIDITFFWWQT